MSRPPHLLVILFLSALVFIPRSEGEEWQWRSLVQVRHIALAVQLADYPFPQGRLNDVTGAVRIPHLGGSWDDRDRLYNIFALSDPEALGGYYALRVVYGDRDQPSKPEEIPIVEVQVLFQVRGGLSFVHEPDRGIKRLLPGLERSMKEKGLTPIAFAQSFLGDPTGEESNSFRSEVRQK